MILLTGKAKANRRAKFYYDRSFIIGGDTLYGIYAHRNKLDGTIFYVGSQRPRKYYGRKVIERSKDFWKSKSKNYYKYIAEIGEENIEIIWLYITNDPDENLLKKEKMFQDIYYNIYKEKFLCYEFCSYGERNPNFGNQWTDEQKKSLSKKRVDKLKNELNPNAKKCTLHFPDGKTKDFSYLRQMNDWIKENITDGIYIRIDKDKFKLRKISAMQTIRREAYKKTIGFYYTERS